MTASGDQIVTLALSNRLHADVDSSMTELASPKMAGEQVATGRTSLHRTVGLVGAMGRSPARAARRGRGAAWALIAVVFAVAPGVAGATPDPTDPGQITPGTVTSNGTDYEYLLYTPSSYEMGRNVPLLVMVHGCQTTAEQQMRATLYNQLSEREGFVVLYPDVDALGRLLPGPANQCWKFPYPPAWTRNNSDAAAIADMTRAVMATRAIDAERVYVIGVSAGGLMASIEAAAYPDLFAAVGIVQSAGYVDWPCFVTGVGIPVTLSAQLAFHQMGPRARVVPRFVVGSNADTAFPAACADKALEQGLRTNNLVISGQQDRPIALTPAAVRHERKPGGYDYTVSSYHDPDGCLIAEQWMIDGMPHAWPGGTTDPRYRGFTDPNAPSGAEASWAFFERYARSDTAMPCATAEESTSASPPAPPDPGETAERADATDGQAGASGQMAATENIPEVDDIQIPGSPLAIPTSTATPALAGSRPSTLPTTGTGGAQWPPAAALLAALLLRRAAAWRRQRT